MNGKTISSTPFQVQRVVKGKHPLILREAYDSRGSGEPGSTVEREPLGSVESGPCLHIASVELDAQRTNGEHGGLPSGSCIQTAAQGKPSQSGDQAALEAPLGWNWSSLSCFSQNRPLTCSSSPLSSLPPLFCTALQTGLSGWATLHCLRCVSISHRILSVTVSPHSLPAPPPPPSPRPALSPHPKAGNDQNSFPAGPPPPVTLLTAT